MSELDTWVTEYEGRVCGAPAYHIYACIKRDGFDEERMFLGAEITIDEAAYEICGLDKAEAGDGTWMLVYAHYIPKSMNESEWHGLYGDPKLAIDG
jgi:hypothetical protein